MNIPNLIQILRGADYASMSPADAATAINAELAARRLKPRSFVRWGTLDALIGPAATSAAQIAIEAMIQQLGQGSDPQKVQARTLDRAYHLMEGQREDDGIDVGLPAAREQITQLAQAGVFSAEHAAVILAVGEDASVPEADVTAEQVVEARRVIAMESVAVNRRLNVGRWAAAETAKVDAWVAGGCVGEVPAVAAFAE